jgi:hypothetical protein
MKVYISNYRNHWLSPYTILKAVCFWEKDDSVFYNHDEEPNHPYTRWINRLDPVCSALQKFLDVVHPKIDYVKIDRYDTWSMDHTLAHIILPMLRQLKQDKHGSPFVDDEDVPEELRSTSAPAKENEWDTDDNHFRRWDWVLDEMIQAFECKVDDSWQDQYRSGVHDIQWIKSKKTYPNPITGKEEATYQMADGPNNTYKCDYDALEKHQERNKNGYRLFGKYYEGLWD